ncbi:LLM class flavin-dependent oxidoreductase [Actinoallomurus soli]|uniref:LLM class flavin-dependent oxidoreductase n=1 Tax=Actinoallomurus soli TaxID=2952535 RepID=UPI002091F63D|nr:LLM class flavin-dependent oxidoreductase [Actinoallomurus soli]MCO5971638.1 LLM class flavin-dependent oxidoreductase [Actinoallomurus soli]
MAHHPEQIAPFAALTRDAGADRLWMGESLLLESHQAFAYLAGRGLRPPVGTSVSLMPLRHPYKAAIEIRSIAALTGRPVVAGFGPGAARLVEALRGAPYESPLTATREYMTALRALIDGRRSRLPGTYVQLHTGLPPLDHPPVELGLGVLRPAMARLAGQVADVAITWLTPPAYLRGELIPALREGAEQAGRQAPRVVAVVQVASAAAARDPRALAEVATRAHVAGPHYVDMLRRAGVDLQGMSPLDVGAALIHHDLFITGSPETIAGALDRYTDLGVDEVVLNTAGVALAEGLDVAWDECAAILKAARS